MSKPEHFEIMQDHAVFRPTGEISLEQGVQLVNSALVYAREQHFKKLLVVTTDVTGFKLPSLSDRYFYVKKWVVAGQGQVCAAFVAKPEIMDREKIELLIAETSGLQVNVFTSEEEALAWLRSVKWVSQEEKIRLRSRVTSQGRQAKA